MVNTISLENVQFVMNHDLKKTPRKVFKYPSVATKIARLFSNPVTSQQVQNRSNSLPVVCMELSSIHSSPAWKE